jgi:hypothetical protein
MKIIENIKARHLSIHAYALFFWLIVLFGLVFIASSYPMMKLRFDIWQHIGNIDNLVNNPELKIGRSNWHKVWAYIFRSTSINDIYEYAVIIHRVQFTLNLILIYFASKLMFSALLLSEKSIVKDINKQWISSLAISSTLVWLTVIGTVSTFQQAWIMWYSVNYQITLSFIFLTVALCINTTVVSQAKSWIILKLVSAILLVYLTYLFHAGELAYFLVYVLFFIILFLKRNQFPYLIAGILFLSLIFYFASIFYEDRIPEIVTLIKNSEYNKIYTSILEHGRWNVLGGNRHSANWNELYLLSISLAVLILFSALTKNIVVNKRVLFFILLSLVFCFVPIFINSSGAASLVVGAGIVNRIYFASYIFLLIPLFFYLVLLRFKSFNKPIYLIITVCILLISVYAYSKFINDEGVYYKNVKSIKNSVYPNIVGVEFTNERLADIAQQIKQAELKYGVDAIIYCANYDIGHIITYQYRRKNIYFDRFNPYGLDECFKYAKSEKKLAVVIN